MIELQHVCKSYPLKTGKHIVLDDVNLRIEEGRSLAILGLNGAGKSTLIRLIGGAEQPDSGRSSELLESHGRLVFLEAFTDL